MATQVITINGVEILKGIEIRFKTHSKNDSQFYSGKVMGIVNYDIAAMHADIDAIHANQEYEVAKKEVTPSWSKELAMADKEDSFPSITSHPLAP